MKHIAITLTLSMGLFLWSCTTPENTSSKLSKEEVKKSAPTIKYSFIVMGCNRISGGDSEDQWKKSEYYNEAHTNKNQLYATFDDALKLGHTPDYFFFVGDLVKAETEGTEKLQKQLSAWVTLYKSHKISTSSIKMVAIPGNHEFLYKNNDKNEVCNPDAHDVWLATMSDYIIGNNGPGKGGDDQLIYDESRLTYSIDHNGDHFVLMNTDTYDEPGKVPVNWINNDITTWRKNNPNNHIFVLGHKPAYCDGSWDTGDKKDPGLANNPDQIKSLWQTINDNKCEAMLSAHRHLYWAGIVPGGNTWQVISGNGGSALESGHHFGFTEVQVMSDGTVTAYVYERPVPNPYYGALEGSTAIAHTLNLTWSGK
jgi:hypothetical protein